MTIGGADHAETPRYRASRADGSDLRMNVVHTIARTLEESRGDYRQLTLVERSAPQGTCRLHRRVLALKVFKREINQLNVDLEEVIRQYVDREYSWAD